MTRFWTKVRTGRSSGCWPWLGAISGGQPHFRFKGKRCLASRIAWELTYGRVPNGKEVCHRCDNRICVNPLHLFLGTHAQNMRDALGKDRLGKLSLRQIQEIRKRYKAGQPSLDISRQYGIAYSTAKRIVSGRTWAGKSVTHTIEELMLPPDMFCCPHCKKPISDEEIKSAGARLMNLSRTNRSRDPKVMRELGRIGGSRPKTAAGRKKRKKDLEAARAEVRRLSAELAKANPPTQRR